MTIGERMVHIAKQKGITQKKLAESIGVTQSTISGWATGSQIKSENLIKAAEFLGVSVEYLMSENCELKNVQSFNDSFKNIHAPVSISNGLRRNLSDNEVELFNVFSTLTTIDQAKVLVFANELKEKIHPVKEI